MHQILLAGRYRKHIERVRSRLQEKRGQVIQRLEQCGLQLQADRLGGMFVWAKLPEGQNAAKIATLASRENIMMAPGNFVSAISGTIIVVTFQCCTLRR